MSKVQELNDWLQEYGGAIRSVVPGDDFNTAEAMAEELLRSLKQVSAELDREKGG